MINGVSDYLLWPIRTLEQAQEDRERWRRRELFDVAGVSNFRKSIDTEGRLAISAPLLPQAAPAPGGESREDTGEPPEWQADLFR